MLFAALEAGMKNAFLCAVVVVLSCGFALGQATEKILYDLCSLPNCSDGAFAGSTPVLDRAGNLYATTMQGGTNGNGGTIFELSPNPDGTWAESVLYSFCNDISDCPTGSSPAGLTIDSEGNLYGVTSYGGLSSCPIVENVVGCGVVFELSPPKATGGAWTYSVLYTFCSVGQSCQDGAVPLDAPTLDSSGNLYGTAEAGQNDAGVVYELSRGNGGWAETILYNFCSTGGNYCSDGLAPSSGVTFDKAGDLFGTTFAGGNANFNTGGALYKLSPNVDGWTETILRTFPRPPGNFHSDPGPVSIDPAGDLFTSYTVYGPNKIGNGLIVELERTGKVRSFSFNGEDGLGPFTGVTVDLLRDVVYGTTGAWPYFCGNVFQINKLGQETVLHDFCQPDDGYGPGGLVEDGLGNLYGITLYGGDQGGAGYGVVFQITP
jgi:hypothetical protein